MEKKILIVDDQFLFRQMLEMALSSNYKIENAEDGSVAIEKLKSFKPDLLILDLMMPNVDGYSVLKEIKQNQEQKPKVIVLTAKHEEQDYIKAKELGADRYITKPFEMDILENNIKELLK